MFSVYFQVPNSNGFGVKEKNFSLGTTRERINKEYEELKRELIMNKFEDAMVVREREAKQILVFCRR